MERKASYIRTFLCGHLKFDENSLQKILNDDSWSEENLSEGEIARLKAVYYESFIQSLIPSQNKEEETLTRHFDYRAHRRCMLRDPKFTGGVFPFTLLGLHVLTFPGDITLWVAEIEIAAEVDLNDYTYAAFVLREALSYSRLEKTSPEYISEIEKLVSLSSDTSENNPYSCLLSTGNKLKVFQIVKTDDLTDELLFETGTFSPIGCVVDGSGPFSPARSYFKRIIEQHKVEIFNNWTALALMDSFTVLMLPATDISLWHLHYFRLIYIHVLYQKTLLFVVNNKFRSSSDWKYTRQLLHEMKQHESRYAFSDISYNFLPEALYKAMDSSLDINAERDSLHEILEQEADRQEAVATKRLSMIILFLTIITVFSVLYDATSLIREFVNSESIALYRWIVIGTIVLIIGGAAWVFRNFKFMKS